MATAIELITFHGVGESGEEVHDHMHDICDGYVHAKYHWNAPDFPDYVDLDNPAELLQEIEEAQEIFERLIDHPGFEGAVFAQQSESIFGASLWRILTNEQLADKDHYPTTSEKLVKYVRQLEKKHTLSTVVSKEETFIRPGMQGKGYGKQLAAKTMEEITNLHPEGAIVITQHRKTNTKMQNISQNMGFVRSGVKWPSTDKDYEMWYYIIPPQSEQANDFIE